MISNKIKNILPDFNESEFISYIDNVFIQIRIALMKQNLEPIKHFLSPEIYSQLEAKLNILKNKKQIEMYDEINVKDTMLLSSYQENNEVFIETQIISRYLNFFIDTNGNYLSGNRQTRVEKENYLTFKKKINSTNTTSVFKCPGCGSAISINKNGKCAYCGSIYNLEKNGWFLVNFEVK